MTHHVEIKVPDYANPFEKKHLTYDVVLNGRKYGELRWNGLSYDGVMSTYDGRLVDGPLSLGEWRKQARLINKAADSLQSSLQSERSGSTAWPVLAERIAVAKALQMDFFAEIGKTPQEIGELDDKERQRVLSEYGEWLANRGAIPLI